MKRGMDGARERKEGLSERRKEGAGREGATERIEEQGRSEEASKGGRDTSEEDLVLQVKNSELVYKLCIVMRRNVLFDRSMA